ncbi:hypothetical protein QBC34DRAFT_183142 [Podospora aff. communis PSN243]|uniref:Uncharacterized protein n=1 Tax=Podospora aff. communis PSN243 TaxID=3040156 RepID=A0AAV9GBF9_9PEZI|nr:hypothetical protein QBC34DRAFT_183142 [Podospora aff. communis PSN243]
MRFPRGASIPPRDAETRQQTPAIFDAFSVPPAGFLFRRANPATIPRGFVGLSLSGRDSVGPTCAANETKCSEGDWCCDTGDTCSLDNGVFLCCAPGAEGAGCSRVCASGDFQCGSICCANGQACAGADTGAPFCVDSSSSSSSLAAATPTPLATSATALPTTTSRPTTTSKPAARSSATSSRSFSTLELAPTNTGTFIPQFPTSIPTSTPSSEVAVGGDIPLGVGIAIGVIVPVVVITMVASLWFFLCRRPRRRSPYSDDPPPPPPKGGIPVTTINHRYTPSDPRSPADSVRSDSTVEMAKLPKALREKPHVAAALAAPREARTAKMRGEKGGGLPTAAQLGVGVAR